MSSLNTFGAVLTYGINMEARIRDYYQGAGNTSRAEEADKRRATLERLRREYVVEITLEPIEGLDENNYVFDFENTTQAGQTAIAGTAAQFYQDAAPKINVRQVQRALERHGKQHAEQAES